MEYLVSLSQFGIVPGSMGKPPYTRAQYDIARNNAIGIIAAFEFAASNNYTKVTLPYNIYSFCYDAPETSSSSANREGGPISLGRRIEIDLNKAVFETIFDSVNKSPFDLSSKQPFELYHNLIWIDNVEDLIIKNPVLRGDVYNRAFTNPLEKSVEQSYGIRFGSNVRRVTVINPDIQGFMGDGIGASNDRSRDLISLAVPDAFPGKLNDNGTIATLPGAFYTASVTLDVAKLKERIPSSPLTCQLKRMGGGVIRTPQIKDDLFELIFLTENNVFIKRAFYKYLDYIVMPHNCKKVALQLYNEDPAQTSVSQGEFPLHFTVPASSDITIMGGRIANNHRGGVSNMPDRTKFIGTRFTHNGLDCSIGAPLFPNSTRYQVDYENMYSDEQVFDECDFDSAFNGLIIASQKFRLIGGKLNNSGGVVLYKTADALIDGVTFSNGGPALIVGKLSAEVGGTRRAKFTNNTVDNTAAVISIPENTSAEVAIYNNTLAGNQIELTGQEVEFNNNKLELKRFDNVLSRSLIHGLKDFSNNKIKQTSGIGTSNFRFYLFDIPKGKGNVFENIYFFRTGHPTTNINSFHIRGCEFKKCIFQTATYNTLEVHEYTDCIFDDTQVPAPGCRIPGSRPKLKFNACTFIIYDIRPFLFYDAAFSETNRTYDLEFDSDCKVIYMNENKPYFIQGQLDSIALRVNVKAPNLTVVNNPDFENTISPRGKA